MSFTIEVVNKTDMPVPLYGALKKYEDLVLTIKKSNKQKAVKIITARQDRADIQKDLVDVIKYCRAHHSLNMEMEITEGYLYIWKV